MKHAEEYPGMIELPTRPRNTRKLPVQPGGTVLSKSQTTSSKSQEVKLLPEQAASKKKK